MTGEIYEYSPSEGSYEYKLIEDFKTSCSFENTYICLRHFLKMPNNAAIFLII